MRHLLLILLLAATAWPQAQAENPTDDTARARALIHKMIQAMGGEAYLSYRDYTQEGRTASFSKGVPTGGNAPFWRFWVWPDKDRIEFTKQRDWIVIHNGDKGFETTFRGTREEDPKDLNNYRLRMPYQTEKVLRQWINAPGTAFFYDGRGIAEAREVEKVTVMTADNRSVTFAINTENSLPVSKSYTVRDPKTGDRTEEEEIFDNWRMLQGINTPHSLTWKRNGEMTRQRFIKTVTYNVGLNDALFNPKLDYDKTKRY
jgi:hypothetical protein